MSQTEFCEIFGDINAKYVQEARTVKAKSGRMMQAKWGAIAACLCLVVIGIAGMYLYSRNYVLIHNIHVYSTNEYNVDSCEVTQIQGQKLGAANIMHLSLSSQNYDWYGSCYYDIETDSVMIGLTENTERHQKQVLKDVQKQTPAIIADTPVQFYTCEYSYQYLEDVYSSLEGRDFVLKTIGIERYYISIRDNRVVVYLSNADCYAAIYAIDKLDNSNGAVIYKSIASSPLRDMQS